MISISACAAQEISSLDASVSGPDADEYAVYSDLINSKYIEDGMSLIVIEDLTSVESGDISQLHGIDNGMIKDYQAKSKATYRLDKLFNLKVNYELISEEEAQDTFDPDPESGWDVFYSTYPESQGMLTLSRVGFNKNRTQALVYAGNQIGPTDGETNYYLLEKEGDAWIVKKVFEAWI